MNRNLKKLTSRGFESPKRRAPVTLVVLCLSIFMLGACSSMKPKDFEGREPKLSMEGFFLGKTRGVGAFFDRSGKIRREFVIDVIGSRMPDSTIRLEEHLQYSDGEKIRRVYTFRKQDDHNYVGEADNGVVGAITVQEYGNAVRWQYDLKTPVGESEWVFRFNDWFFLLEDGLVLNKGRATKWGFHVGDIMMTLRKMD